MSLPVPNLDSYNQQIAAIQKQLESLNRPVQQPQPAMSYGIAPQINQIQPAVQPITPVQIPVQIKYVDGISGAKEYQSKMLDNSSEIVMDRNEDIFYVVSKDANGVSPKFMTIGRFTIEQETADEPMFMTKKDFESFKDEIRALLMENKTQQQREAIPVQEEEIEVVNEPEVVETPVQERTRRRGAQK